MKQVKDSILLHNILLLLSENEYISVSKIASILETSDSTVRRKIDEMNDILKSSGYGCVQKFPRKGLHLEARDSSAIPQLFYSFGSGSIRSWTHRIDNYLFILLSQKDRRMTLNELSVLGFDSIPVVRKKLKECEQWLNAFSLQLKIKKNYGISIDGREEHIRLAIRNLVLNNELYGIGEGIGFFAKGLDLTVLKKCFYTMKCVWDLNFAEESFHSMFIYAALAIVRSKNKKLLISAPDRETISKFQEYNWSKAVFRLIEKEFSVKISEEEILFFSIQLLCSYLIHSDEKDENSACNFDEKLKTFVLHIIEVISELLDMDLTGDSELYYGLLNHIRPAIFRMHFQQLGNESLGKFIKDEYKQMYRVSWALSILFEKCYGINISSTELSYIALYFQASMERLSKPVTMALVTDLGMGLNQLLSNKIKMSDIHVEKIITISRHAFDRGMLEQYDLIVTTSELNVISEKVLQIGSLLSEKELVQIKQRLKLLKTKKLKTKATFDPSCREFIDAKLIFTDLKVGDKAQLLQLLSHQLVSLGYVTVEYHDSILKREKTVSTCIGNGVAIPHGNSAFARTSRLVVAILDNPIMWDTENSVGFIFLLAFKISSKADSKRIQLFYKGFLELIETESNLEYLKSLTREELYQYLIQ